MLRRLSLILVFVGAACSAAPETPRQYLVTAEAGFTAAVVAFTNALDVVQEDGTPLISTDSANIGLRAAEAGNLALDTAHTTLAAYEGGNEDMYGAIFAAIGEVVAQRGTILYILGEE